MTVLTATVTPSHALFSMESYLAAASSSSAACRSSYTLLLCCPRAEVSPAPFLALPRPLPRLLPPPPLPSILSGREGASVADPRRRCLIPPPPAPPRLASFDTGKQGMMMRMRPPRSAKKTTGKAPEETKIIPTLMTRKT